MLAPAGSRLEVRAAGPRAAPEVEAAAACFTACNDFTLFVLPGTGHNHNVAPDRELLWERFVNWARVVWADAPVQGRFT